MALLFLQVHAIHNRQSAQILIFLVPFLLLHLTIYYLPSQVSLCFSFCRILQLFEVYGRVVLLQLRL